MTYVVKATINKLNIEIIFNKVRKFYMAESFMIFINLKNIYSEENKNVITH